MRTLMNQPYKDLDTLQKKVSDQKSPEKVLSILRHHRNVNKNRNEIPTRVAQIKKADNTKW